VILIGFAGRKQSGKDTAAEALASLGFERIAFAGALKFMLLAFLRYRGVSDGVARHALEGDLKERPLSELGYRSMRYAMQTLGTEWGRDLMAPDIWIEAAMDRARLFSRVVISDVRFPNEVAAIRSRGGRVFWIERPGLQADDAHISEGSITAQDCDGVILNNYGSAIEFACAVVKLLST